MVKIEIIFEGIMIEIIAVVGIRVMSIVEIIIVEKMV